MNSRKHAPCNGVKGVREHWVAWTVVQCARVQRAGGGGFRDPEAWMVLRRWLDLKGLLQSGGNCVVGVGFGDVMMWVTIDSYVR